MIAVIKWEWKSLERRQLVKLCNCNMTTYLFLTKHCVQNVCIIGRPTRFRLLICSDTASLLNGTKSVDKVTIFMGLPYWRLHSIGSWLRDWRSTGFRLSNSSLSPASETNVQDQRIPTPRALVHRGPTCDQWLVIGYPKRIAADGIRGVHYLFATRSAQSILPKRIRRARFPARRTELANHGPL